MADSDLTRRTIDPFFRDLQEVPAVLDLLHHNPFGPISEPLLERVSLHTQSEKIRRDLELAGEARERAPTGFSGSLAPLTDRVEVRRTYKTSPCYAGLSG